VQKRGVRKENAVTVQNEERTVSVPSETAVSELGDGT
jgi:hypothetical protein